jgi:hypothetical protein
MKRIENLATHQLKKRRHLVSHRSYGKRGCGGSSPQQSNNLEKKLKTYLNHQTNPHLHLVGLH